MDWREVYSNKIMSAAEAVKCIKSNDTVMFQQSHGESQLLLKAMVDRADELENVNVMGHIQWGPADYAKPEMVGHFKGYSNFLASGTRKACKEGRVDYLPVFYFETPRCYREIKSPDVFFIMLSEPNEDGICSYSLNPDYSVECVRVAKKVVAQINKNLPWTNGSLVSLEDIDYIVEEATPVPEVGMSTPGEIEMAIGNYISPLIEDGSTLQLGIGGIPDAVLSCLMDKKDIGIHSELFSDGVVDLYNAGVINNSKKTLHPGKFIANFLVGTKKLFDFVDKNDDVILLPVDYVNDPRVIAQNDKMVSINACMQVDLLGQINSESLNGNQFSGVGGQVDFVRGASMSKGGQSFITLPSTAKKGAISRIVCQFEKGTAITTSRYDVQYIVTEFGIVNLRGMSVTERGKALISIAHPNFRSELTQQAIEAGILFE